MREIAPASGPGNPSGATKEARAGRHARPNQGGTAHRQVPRDGKSVSKFLMPMAASQSGLAHQVARRDSLYTRRAPPNRLGDLRVPVRMCARARTKGQFGREKLGISKVRNRRNIATRQKLEGCANFFRNGNFSRQAEWFHHQPIYVIRARCGVRDVRMCTIP